MNQTFGCVILEREKGFFRKDRLSKSIAEIGLKVLTQSSESFLLKDYLVSNTLKDNEILAGEMGNTFLILGHSLYFPINKDSLGSIKKTKRTLFQFTQHGKSREYGYKYYYKVELCTHEICFGENNDLYQRSILKNNVKLPQSAYPEKALNFFANEKQIPVEVLDTLRACLNFVFRICHGHFFADRGLKSGVWQRQMSIFITKSGRKRVITKLKDKT